MQAFKARVENGRIVVNEATDLPEGTELYLVPADSTDELKAEGKLAVLNTALEEGERSGVAPEGVFDRVRRRLNRQAQH